MKKFLLITALISTSCLADPAITLNATTDNAYALEGRNAWAYSQHDIQIINDTNEDKNYSYGYSICVTNHGCNSKDNYVTVKAHKQFNNHCDLGHAAVYKYAGTYEIIATTRVSDQSKIAKALVQIKE